MSIPELPGSVSASRKSGDGASLYPFAGSLASSPSLGGLASGVQPSAHWEYSTPSHGLASEGLCLDFSGSRSGIWHHLGVTARNLIPGTMRPLGNEQSL